MEGSLTEKQVRAALLCLPPEYVARMAAKLSAPAAVEKLALWASLIRAIEAAAGMSAEEIKSGGWGA